MAEIRPYTSQVVAQGGRATPDAFGGQVAAATMNLAGAGMDVQKALYEQEVQQEVNDIQVQMAKARAEWTTQLRDRANQAKPGDETFTPRLTADMDKYFEGMAANVKTNRGRQVFDSLTANMKADFVARGIATQSALAAAGAKQNVQDLQDAGGKTVLQDPSQRDSVLRDNLAYIQNLPGIDSATRTALVKGAEEYVNRMAVLGQIQRDPNELLARIDPRALEPGAPERQQRTGDPAFDALPADQQFQLIKQAREYRSAYETESEVARRRAEREKKEAQETDMRTYTARILAPGGENGPIPSAREIMGNQILDAAQREHLVKLTWAAERERSEQSATKSNPQTVQRLYGRIVAAQDDPKKLMSEQEIQQEFIRGNINRTELDWLVKNVQDLRDPDKAPFRKSVNAAMQNAQEGLKSWALARGQRIQDPGFMPAILDRVRSELETEIIRYRQQGKDPRVLLDGDPNNREYFFRPGRLATYAQEYEVAAATRRAEASAGAIAADPSMARKPGESITDWKARTGK